jgi:hypothetical protein
VLFVIPAISLSCSRLRFYYVSGKEDTMLTGVHFLLTYKCTFECDHCFLYCGPNSEGTFTTDRVEELLGQMKEIDSVYATYFEGGEPFLYYPLMLESLRLSKSMGFKTGLVTNGYWAESERDAELWLKPIAEIGIDDLSVSDDPIHYPSGSENNAKRAVKAAGKLGIPCGSICIEEPKVIHDEKTWRGEPVHPIIGPILKGGPAELARKYNFDITPGFVDHCHLCFLVRRGLVDRFPDTLTPKQVYGLDSES